MDKFFDSGNPVMKFLARLVDLAVLNIFTVLYSIPLVTAGGAMAAMNHVLLHLVRKDETYVIRMFKDSFRENFRQSIPEGLLVILIGIITAVDMWALHGSESRLMTLMMIIITVLVCGMSMQSCTSKDFDEAVENTFDGIAANIRLKGTWDRKDRIPSDVRTIRYLKLNQDDGNWEFTLVEVLGDQKIVNTGTWKTTGKYSVIVLKVKNAHGVV